jgi:hypothetical protein
MSMKISTAFGAAMIAAATPVFAAEPDSVYCEKNKVASEQAAANAVTTHHELNMAVNGAIVGGGCGLLMWAAAVDGGLSFLLCSVATASAVVGTSTPADAYEIAGKAWAEVRDQRCLK